MSNRQRCAFLTINVLPQPLLWVHCPWAAQLSLQSTALDHLGMRWSERKNWSWRNLRQEKGIPWREDLSLQLQVKVPITTL